MLIVIGDTHGCWDELRALLDEVAPAEGDTIVSVGDLVDRGPKPVEVARFFRDTPGARAILGNHEDKHVRWGRRELEPAPSQTICREQAGDAYPELLAFFEGLPPYLDLPEALVVHAGYEPDLPLGEQPRNVLLRGKWPGEGGLGGDPARWTSRYRGDKPVVYGHTVFDEPRIAGRTFGIDTGVYRGGRLTALLLPSERLVSVPAREHHWSRTRAQYAADRERPPGEALVTAALRAAERLLAPMPAPDGPRGRRALAAALGAHRHCSELFALAFATDRRAALLRHPLVLDRVGRGKSTTEARRYGGESRKTPCLRVSVVKTGGFHSVAAGPWRIGRAGTRYSRGPSPSGPPGSPCSRGVSRSDGPEGVSPREIGVPGRSEGHFPRANRVSRLILGDAAQFSTIRRARARATRTRAGAPG